ncbi:pyridoxal-dependent decarboxylase [Pseudobacteriovorax antillogorgiicola]|uniref:Tyrosine decarboxylase n=1 Tax=Pseudobacteriovorax antillogorgiicola TaxID=1513793 RepID=A0A1Y6CNI1_9BACT|nr:pyridoxal-dependent decarboxylase [Pseudobacteriovorax antillogorgiicola]TCS44786.1 tyrosine decarboxylase [Pseudobacteriovorax antillogorgiicola]SMF77464.1 tyrosine decarboxylase [Pseudobacteriovorax antillogorgiicola]
MTDQSRMSPPIFDADELAEQGRKIISLLENLQRRISQNPVKPNCHPGDLAKLFSSEPPEQGIGWQRLIQDLEGKITEGATLWQHPRFFAYYPANTSLPAVLAETMIAGLASVGLQWSANPIATELECVVMDWILKMLHAPQDSPFYHHSCRGGGVIQNTAGDALVNIMVAARVACHQKAAGIPWDKPLDEDQRESLFYQDSSRLVVYMSDQTHFSGPKAVRVAGMRVNIIKSKLLSDGNYGIDRVMVAEAMASDRRQGLRPCALQLNYGSTNTCGMDDMKSFLGFAQAEGVWLHVDAAYAGASLILPEFQGASRVIQEIADSFNFNGSKWFLCGFDSAFLYVRDRRLMKQVYAAGGDYLATVDEEGAYNPEFKDWAVPLGRRFRSLRIWMVLSYFGVTGMQAFLRKGIEQANRLRSLVDQSSDFETIVACQLGLVCVGLKDGLQERWVLFWEALERRSENGRNFLVYPSKIEGRFFLRIALGGVNTEDQDVDYLWSQLNGAVKEIKVHIAKI